MTLVVLFGPQAVGKMTVGQALCEKTGFKLFHNHMTIDMLKPVFGFGSESFNRLNDKFRLELIEEAAQTDLPGLVFTYVWALNHPSDLLFINKLEEILKHHGGEVFFVELEAPLAIRKERNLTENRARQKPDNVEHTKITIDEYSELYKLNSDGDFVYPDRHLKIDNSHLPPDEAAEMIRNFLY